MLQTLRIAVDEVCVNANLYRRFKQGKGKNKPYQFLRCVDNKPGFVKKGDAEIPASAKAPFYVRVSNTWTRVDDPTKLKAVTERATVKAEAERSGIIERRREVQVKGVLIADAVDSFLLDKRRKNRAPRTLLAVAQRLR